MTTTMQTADLVAAMADAAARAVAEATGLAITATVPAPGAAAVSGDGDTVARSTFTNGAGQGGLVTIVPSSGMASAEGIDVNQLISAIAEGAAAGMTQLSGSPVQAAPAEPLAPDAVDTAAAEVFEFDLQADSDTMQVRWVVEAALGALLANGDPVDPLVSEGPSVAPATLPELTPGVAAGRARDLQLLADVPMNVSVEIGRGSLQVRELLSLVQGSIVELDRVVGSPVDVMVNGTLVAHGDIVLVGDDLGVRITEIVEPI